MNQIIRNSLVGLCAVLAASAASAGSLNLTGGGSGTLNSTFFTTTDVGSTGTGVISPFLRVQANGEASGYNASTNSVMPDVKTGTWTHDIQLSAIPIVVNPTGAAAGSYYEFLLDINQTNANPQLSLDTVQLYTRSTVIDPANTLALLTGSSTLRYNLDSNAANYVLLNYDLNAGSGSGDLFMYVPTSYFAAASGSDYLYFYTQFGLQGGNYAENDGFEEWAVRTAAAPSVPDGGATALLLGGALLGLAAVRRRFSK
jgi:hypothetical protein